MTETHTEICWPSDFENRLSSCVRESMLSVLEVCGRLQQRQMPWTAELQCTFCTADGRFGIVYGMLDGMQIFEFGVGLNSDGFYVISSIDVIDPSECAHSDDETVGPDV